MQRKPLICWDLPTLTDVQKSADFGDFANLILRSAEMILRSSAGILIDTRRLIHALAASLPSADCEIYQSLGLS